MYNDAIRYGISIEAFWNMSLMEIFDYVNIMKKKENDEIKKDIKIQFLISRSNAEHIGSFLISDVKPLELWEIFPDIFAEEKLRYLEMEQDREMHEAQENRRRIAEAQKQRRFEKEMTEIEAQEK